jgi:hypothetical protein
MKTAAKLSKEEEDLIRKALLYATLRRHRAKSWLEFVGSKTSLPRLFVMGIILSAIIEATNTKPQWLGGVTDSVLTIVAGTILATLGALVVIISPTYLIRFGSEVGLEDDESDDELADGRTIVLEHFLIPVAVRATLLVTITGNVLLGLYTGWPWLSVFYVAALTPLLKRAVDTASIYFARTILDDGFESRPLDRTLLDLASSAAIVSSGVRSWDDSNFVRTTVRYIEAAARRAESRQEVRRRTSWLDRKSRGQSYRERLLLGSVIRGHKAYVVQAKNRAALERVAESLWSGVLLLARGQDMTSDKDELRVRRLLQISRAALRAAPAMALLLLGIYIPSILSHIRSTINPASIQYAMWATSALSITKIPDSTAGRVNSIVDHALFPSKS